MNLHEELQRLQAQLDEENTKPEINVDLVNMLKNRISELEYQISNTGPEAQPAAVVTAVAHTLPIDFNELFGTNLLNHTIQSLLDEQYLKLQTDFESRLEERETQRREVEQQLEATRGQVQTLIDEKSQAVLERNDYEQRWKNATTLIEERDAEISGLKLVVDEKQKHIEQLRVDLANAAAIKAPIDVTPKVDIEEFKRQVAAERASKPKVYDVAWEDDIRKTHYVGTDENGTRVRIPMLELGKWNVQVTPFRPKDPAELVQTDAQAGVEQESSFPGTALPAVNPPAVYEAPADRGLDEGINTREPVLAKSVEERLSALEKAVFGWNEGVKEAS